MPFFSSLCFMNLTCLLRALLPQGLCWLFLHLLHCLTTSPFTRFKNDLASFFITIGLEIAWGGMFKEKLVWCWRLNSRLPCKNFKSMLLEHKPCLALTKLEMYLWAWGSFCSLWATLIGMAMHGVLERVFIMGLSWLFAWIFSYRRAGFKFCLSVGRVIVQELAWRKSM